MRINPIRTLIQRLGRQKWFATAFKGISPPVDRFLYRVTRGRVALLTMTGLHTLLLTTTGRKSGKARTVPLLYAPYEGGAYLVVGSNWGQAAAPAWSGNLMADPVGTVQVRGRTSAVRARLVEGEERARVWDGILVKIWPGYENYAERSGRDIRVFSLEPIDR